MEREKIIKAETVIVEDVLKEITTKKVIADEKAKFVNEKK
jgi:hypothetical protein